MMKLTKSELKQISSFLQNMYSGDCMLPQPWRIKVFLRNFSGFALLSLTDDIEQFLKKGCRVTIKLTKQEIPSEYFGVLELWDEGILEFQKYLKLPTELIEKISPDPLFPSDQVGGS